MVKLKKPRTADALSPVGSKSIDNLLRKMQAGFGYDPLVELISIARSTKSSVAEKIKIAQELMQYVYPKVKAMATDPNMGDVINITVKYDDDKDADLMKSSLPTPFSEEELVERRRTTEDFPLSVEL